MRCYAFESHREDGNIILNYYQSANFFNNKNADEISIDFGEGDPKNSKRIF